MNISFESKAIKLSAGGFSCLLSLPKLRVTEGILSPATCQDLRQQSCQGQLTLEFLWQVQSRVYKGQLGLEDCGCGASWQLQVSPEDGKGWSLFSSEEGSCELLGWTEVTNVALFHGDNIRGVSQDCTLMEGTYFVPLSQWKRPLNAGRWQSFPGLWLRELSQSQGFVSGVLSQEKWKHTVQCEKVSSLSLHLRGEMTPPGIEMKSFAAGEFYQGERLYFEWNEATTPVQAFAGYLDALSLRFSPAKSRSFLRKTVSWDSWNDRQPNFWDVSEALLVRTAEVLRERFPSVRTLQVDDGYADGGFHEIEADRWGKLELGLDPDTEAKIERARRLGAAFLHEPDYSIARDRFPNGMREASDRIVRMGFTPGIWLGLNLVFDAALAKDHPDWMVHSRVDSASDPELYEVFGGHPTQGFRVLDISLPEVRCYLERVAKVLFEEWGFVALKLDFWSYVFENDSFRLQRSDKTAFEWRTWFFELFRSKMAVESFFTIGCDISTGNPFLCSWVDNVRYGIDIGNGKWENIKYTAFSGTFLLHIEAYRFYILNCDSVGLLENLPKNQRLVFWAWAAATRSLCEVAGDLAHQPREKLRPLQKLLLAPKNGEPVFLGEMWHLEKDEPAAVVWTRGDLFSTLETNDHLPDAVLAVFNWSDTERAISVDGEQLGFPLSRIADVEFFDEHCLWREGGKWEVTLPPCSVRLSHLSFISSGMRVLASSWEILSITWQEGDGVLRLRGDAPLGILIYWPYTTMPELKSSLPAGLDFVEAHIVRVRPEILVDKIQEWEFRIFEFHDRSRFLGSHP